MLAGLQAESRLAPRGDRRGQANRALAFAAAVRVIARVHNHAADARTDAHVTGAAGLTDAHVAVISIAHGADGRLRVHGDHANFAGGEANLRIRAFLRHQLSGVAGAADKLAAAARNKLDVVDQRAHCTAAEAYDSFCDEVENCLPFIFGASSSIRDLDPDANDEKRLLRGTIVAAVNKMYLDCCFVAMRQEQALWPGILGDLE